jgi:hypothetical protein
MKKVVPPRFLLKAKAVLGKFARGKGFGNLSLDNLELLLEQPGRLFKTKISEFRTDGGCKKIYIRQQSWKIRNLKLKEKEVDLYE